jgi:acyl-coenzyme A thioesterase PaaI-like protein
MFADELRQCSASCGRSSWSSRIACEPRAELERRAVTLRLSLDYLGPGRIGDWLQAEGEVVGHDEQVAQVRGRLYGPRHEVLAGLGAFALLSRQRTLKTRS